MQNVRHARFQLIPLPGWGRPSKWPEVQFLIPSPGIISELAGQAVKRNILRLKRSAPVTFPLSFWETQRGHVRGEDQTSHLQLTPPPHCAHVTNRREPSASRRSLERGEGVSRVEGSDKVNKICRIQITGLSTKNRIDVLKRGSEMVRCRHRPKCICPSLGIVRTLRSCRRGNKTRHPPPPPPSLSAPPSSRSRRPPCAFTSTEQPPDGLIHARPCTAWEAVTLVATCALPP